MVLVSAYREHVERSYYDVFELAGADPEGVIGGGVVGFPLSTKPFFSWDIVNDKGLILYLPRIFTQLLSFRYHSEKRVLLSALSKVKIFCFDWPFLIRNIFLFCFCVLFSYIYPKIKFTVKNWSDLCNFCSKVIFWNFCLRKYFSFSLLNLNYWCFTKILWKFQKKWSSGTCCNSASQVTYPADFCLISIHYYCGKKSENIWYLKKTMTRLNNSVHR